VNDDSQQRATRPHVTSAPVRYWDRLLDGSRVWGSIDVGLERQGFRRYRLVLFPPGVTKAERRLLRLWRGLPTWAALVWLMSVIVLSKAWSPWVALGVATVVHVAVGAVILDRVRVLRTQVRTLSVVLITGYPHPGTEATYAEMKKIAAVLCTADFMHAQGRISAAEHESIWWQAYQRLDLAKQGSA
jgi:hypothetical protein